MKKRTVTVIHPVGLIIVSKGHSQAVRMLRLHRSWTSAFPKNLVVSLFLHLLTSHVSISPLHHVVTHIPVILVLPLVTHVPVVLILPLVLTPAVLHLIHAIGQIEVPSVRWKICMMTTMELQSDQGHFSVVIIIANTLAKIGSMISKRVNR
jgi:hypothetical protein